MPGPFYFAWVEAGEAFDAVQHAREDEDIFEFRVEQNEGEFASLTLSVQESAHRSAGRWPESVGLVVVG